MVGVAEEQAATTTDLAGLDRDQLVAMYRMMVRIRRFEERLKVLFMDARLYGSVHLYVGEEAVATGVCSALRDDDLITSTHRGHGHCLAKGMEMRGMMAELMGKATGYCKGKGGSMHIADLDLGVLGANGIVGAGLPIATGAALGNLRLGSDRVAVSFFGDGGANQGAFHEAINLAAVLKLPVVYVCENNQFAQFQRVTEDSSVKDIATRAIAYNIPGHVIDGQDVLTVYRTVKDAVERARGGEGPSLIECKTYRFVSHAGAGKGEHNNPEELEDWLKRDPIALFESKLVDEGQMTGAEQEEMRTGIRAEVEEAESFAQQSPFPRFEDMPVDPGVSL
ncbi:MAG: pyruvate dehydrogenase (acetyl-transferring) E1 component subunit alpha [Dehalococcoidia bacterium]|nr:pyruvate dehydrogenase (acetyl-transferring) E1 component subunit alpha [Dehalococcoidia bacterium]